MRKAIRKAIKKYLLRIIFNIYAFTLWLGLYTVTNNIATLERGYQAFGTEDIIFITMALAAALISSKHTLQRR